MTPRLIKGDIVVIGDQPYDVVVGCPKDKLDDPEAVYNCHLRSLDYNPNRFKSDYFEKNINLPPFEKVT